MNEKNEKEVIERVKKDSENLNIPENLKPHNIEGFLLNMGSDRDRNRDRNRDGNRGKRRTRAYVFRFASIAAVIMLLVLGAANSNNFKKQVSNDIRPSMKSDIENNKENIYEEPENYDDIYKVLKKISKKEKFYINRDQKIEGVSPSFETNGSSDKVETVRVRESSSTNIQVEGVDEGYIVKNDDRYIYALNQNRDGLFIIKTDNGNMEIEYKINFDIEKNDSISEIYMYDNTLVVLTQNYSYTRYSCTDSVPSNSGKNKVKIYTYDISDRKNPTRVGEIEQEGIYNSSRRVGDYLYTFTGYRSDAEEVYKDQSKGIPKVNGEMISSKCIYMPENPDTKNFIVVSSVDLKNPSKVLDSQAVLSNGHNYYVSRENIYIAENLNSRKYYNGYSKTEIIKFCYNEGEIKYLTKGTIKGSIDNSFSMDEYEGNLRVVSTVFRSKGDSDNSLYVLNDELKVIGKIENLAKNERIYSARFMGDVGYFVTFRQVDPLFSVDLSDPVNPKIIGELKITGFSEYLHFYSDNLLLGIGKEVDPITNSTIGIKLSMFDISDSSNVKEINKYVMDDFKDASALYNHKAVMIDTDKNIFGFSMGKWYEGGYSSKYRVFEYNKSGFNVLLERDIKNNQNENYYEYAGAKSNGVYIGDYLYIIEGSGGISSFDMDKYELKETILIK